MTRLQHCIIFYRPNRLKQLLYLGRHFKASPRIYKATTIARVTQILCRRLPLYYAAYLQLVFSSFGPLNRVAAPAKRIGVVLPKDIWYALT